MTDPRVEKLAQILVNYCIDVQADHKVALLGHHVPRPLMIAAYREVIRAGGHPFVLWNDSDMQEIMLKEGNEEQLIHLPAPLKLMANSYDSIKQFTKSILFDEKIGGTIHMALGQGFAEVNGRNASSVHWDMICDMRDGGKIWVDDELFYDSGAFVVI